MYSIYQRHLSKIKDADIFLNISLHSYTMRWRRRVSISRYFPSLFSQYLTNGPTTWMNRPHASVRCCCLGQLFSWPQYAKDVRHSVSCKPSRAGQSRDRAIVINGLIFFVMINQNFTRKYRRDIVREKYTLFTEKFLLLLLIN